MSDQKANKVTNPFAKILMYFVAIVLVGPIEGTKTLFRRTYSENDDIVPAIIGVLAALASGIGIGYHLGWHLDAPTWKWLVYGLGAAAGTFFYAWPALYLVILKWPFRLSERLWKHVNIDGEDSHPPAWFSQFLIGTAYVGSVLIGLYAAYQTDIYVQAHQAGWWWLGALLGIFAAILAVIVVVAILSAAGSLSRGFAFFVFALMAGATWWFWGIISILVIGAWHSLTGDDWGAWGYVAGVIPALIAGIASGAIAWTIVSMTRLRLVALLTGVGTVYALAPTTAKTVAAIDPGNLAFVAPALPWVAYALEMLIFVGFLFPIAHIAITHGLKRLANIAELMEEVYGDRTPYRGFFAQVLNLTILAAVVYFGPGLIADHLGVSTYYYVIGITILAACASYLALGSLLTASGSWPVGVAAAGAAGWATFNVVGFGLFGSLACAAAAAVLTFVVAFPLVYLGARLVLRPLLASWLAEPLVRFHRAAVDVVADLFESFFEASQRTYGDRTPYRSVFLHTVNLAMAVGVAFGAWHLTSVTLAFAVWLAAAITVLATLLSYLLAGKFLLKTGNPVIGVIAGVAGGIFVGSFAHAAQDYGYWVSVPVGLVAAALTYGLVFPIAYLIVRAIINITSPERWLEPALAGAHGWCWTRFTSVWEDFKSVYRRVRDSIKPFWESLKATYEEVRQNVANLFPGNKS